MSDRPSSAPTPDRASTGDPAGDRVRRRLLVTGRVQGVGYRVSCARRARRSGLAGHVRNLDDGRVEVVLQGPPGAVAELVDWCRSGPASARVEAVAVSSEQPDDDAGPFAVTR